MNADSEECTRVLLVDDQRVISDALELLLEEFPGIVVAGRAETGLEAIEMVRTIDVDVVVMDMRMPDLDGISATKVLTEEFPDIAVVLHSAYTDDALVEEAQRAGARGFLAKGAAASMLVSVIANCVRFPGLSLWAPEPAGDPFELAREL